MSTAPLQITVQNKVSLTSLPTEVLIKIFGFLPSFSEAFAFAASCRRLRCVWIGNTNQIYRGISPRSIPCERLARRFYAVQGGPTVGSPLSAQDVYKMVRNTNIVDKAMKMFEREIVSRVRNADGPKHPPHLSKPERQRFFRSYYHLWTHMRLDPTQWPSHLASLTLKQLYLLYEASHLTPSIGREEFIPPPAKALPDADPTPSSHTELSEKRRVLQTEIWRQIWDTVERIHGGSTPENPIHTHSPEYPWTEDVKTWGYRKWVCIWDHYQYQFKWMVLDRDPKKPPPISEREKEGLWSDSEDEEV
ncbi:hypothetical protein GQ43DRAFT_480790 [Delitschia confertaspora ATCC 74209]|uniref:F-box domain-containing protein n=1 Tax=Delitschia confertaspora ATCC 74209 TaxID=1513339 RepID=A0A9P4JLI5_9PLEO|nr:hypothetical protein GQ43DRAFT_480790 [Delitschia confertaspora ATCC 74209]